MRHALYVMRDTDMFVRESPFPIPVGILYLWFDYLLEVPLITCTAMVSCKLQSEKAFRSAV